MANDTGTIQSAASQVITHLASDAIQLGFTNGASNPLLDGQQVTLKTNGQVDIRDGGTDFPAGLVVKGGAVGARVQVRVPFEAVVNRTVKTSNLASAGVFVKDDGTVDANGIPNIVVCANGDYAYGVLLTPGNVGAQVVVGILKAPFAIPIPAV